MAQRRATRERQAADSAKTNVEKESNVRSFADRDARARRAARSAAVRGALSGAKRSVEGALSGVHKQIRDKKAQLKKGFSDTGEKAKAALSRVARGGRRVMNAVRGGVQGAKIGAQVGYNYPLKTSAERSPARERTQQRRDVAKATASDTFSRPKAKSVVVGSYPGRKAEPAPKAPVKSRSMVSAKSRARMDKNKEAYEKAKQKLNASVDYDLLTQYMIEDLIDEGYAETEAQAITILEDMSEENLNEFAAQYIQD
jgi:carbonic anhydrase/acetyltransferase-like protein (isoleucine patch superfamily)